MQQTHTCVPLLAATSLLLAASPVIGQVGNERSVQIRSIDFETGVIELFNFDSNAIDLSGWRFCTHDFDQAFRYTSPTAFNGVNIPAGGSVLVHFNNDADPSDPLALNRADFGAFAFAEPLDQDAYGMQIFFPGSNGIVSFGTSALIADHLQWNTNGSSVGQAQTRTAQAVSEGLWTGNGAFIATLSDSARIELVDLSGNPGQGPSDYQVQAPIPSERSVQIRSIDFENGLIELFNFASVGVDLSGWRFCTHDFDQNLRYTSPAGLNGVTIPTGESFVIHFNNDADISDPLAINRSALGAFAEPLDQDAYGMQLFFPGSSGSVSFGNSTLIADHLQWNLDGAGVGQSETRTAQAVSEGLWTSNGDFISTENDSILIDLIDLSGDEAGGPSEYAVSAPVVECIPDVTTTGATLEGQPGFGVPDGAADLDDLGFFLGLWLVGDLQTDFTTTGATLEGQPGFGVPDGAVDLDDLGFFVNLWLLGCP
ncbi:MAG: GC-type dockerin domain-anchored protein [Planctomycetota bacterium]